YEFRDKKIKEHLGGIKEFLAARKIESLRELEVKAPQETQKEKPQQVAVDNKTKYLEKKETERVYRRLKKQVEDTEAAVTAVENDIAAMDAKISSGDPALINDASFFKTYEDKKSELDSLMLKWESANSELEEFVSEYMTEK
ncbi:MAG TPA: ABC transporter ATP-binding protein, partial [Bacteroidales bacterium]|nr:ABC transporter ATP-binding protein [Bacteroidales bacterium]